MANTNLMTLVKNQNEGKKMPNPMLTAAVVLFGIVPIFLLFWIPLYQRSETFCVYWVLATVVFGIVVYHTTKKEKSTVQNEEQG